jgi:hypothetical protein
MIEHWAETRLVVQALTHIATDVRTPGTDLMLVSDQEIHRSVSQGIVLEHLDRALNPQSPSRLRPRGNAVLKALTKASWSYVSALDDEDDWTDRRTWGAGRAADCDATKPLILLVLTDGEWIDSDTDSSSSFEELSLRLRGATPDQVRISFIQIGASTACANRISQLVYYANTTSGDGEFARTSSHLHATGNVMDMLSGPSDESAFGKLTRPRGGGGGGGGRSRRGLAQAMSDEPWAKRP